MLIKDADRKKITELLEKRLEKPVKLVLFTHHKSILVLPGAVECQLCDETEALLTELAALSPKIEAEVHDFTTDTELASKYRIDKIPAIAVVGDRDRGVRFFGMPLQYEFASFLEAIFDASGGRTDLADATKKRLSEIDTDLHIQVFVTPQCPYCPQVVRLAHKMAAESDRVRADVVESMEFPDLANKYDVMGVPRTIVNDGRGFEGAMPEPLFLLFVLKEAGLLKDEEKEILKKIEEAQSRHGHDHDHEHDHGRDHGKDGGEKKYVSDKGDPRR